MKFWKKNKRVPRNHFSAGQLKAVSPAYLTTQNVETTTPKTVREGVCWPYRWLGMSPPWILWTLVSTNWRAAGSGPWWWGRWTLLAAAAVTLRSLPTWAVPGVSQVFLGSQLYRVACEPVVCSAALRPSGIRTQNQIPSEPLWPKRWWPAGWLGGLCVTGLWGCPSRRMSFWFLRRGLAGYKPGFCPVWHSEVGLRTGRQHQTSWALRSSFDAGSALQLLCCHWLSQGSHSAVLCSFCLLLV